MGSVNPSLLRELFDAALGFLAPEPTVDAYIAPDGLHAHVELRTEELTQGVLVDDVSVSALLMPLSRHRASQV